MWREKREVIFKYLNIILKEKNVSNNIIHIYKRKPRCGNNIICINKLSDERVWSPLAKLEKNLPKKK